MTEQLNWTKSVISCLPFLSTLYVFLKGRKGGWKGGRDEERWEGREKFLLLAFYHWVKTITKLEAQIKKKLPSSHFLWLRYGAGVVMGSQFRVSPDRKPVSKMQAGTGISSLAQGPLPRWLNLADGDFRAEVPFSSWVLCRASLSAPGGHPRSWQCDPLKREQYASSKSAGQPHHRGYTRDFCDAVSSLEWLLLKTSNSEDA